MLFQLKAVRQFHFLDRVLWLRWSKHTHLFLSMKGLLHIKQTANIPFVVWIGTSWHSSESLAWWNASIDCRFIYFSSERLTTTTTNSVALLVLVYLEWICINLGIIKKNYIYFCFIELFISCCLPSLFVRSILSFCVNGNAK